MILGGEGRCVPMGVMSPRCSAEGRFDSNDYCLLAEIAKKSVAKQARACDEAELYCKVVALRVHQIRTPVAIRVSDINRGSVLAMQDGNVRGYLSAS